MEWDEKVSPEMNMRWNEIIKMLVLANPATFQRRARPETVCGPPEFVLFSDGSNVAYCAALYIRWPTLDSSPGPWALSYDQTMKWRAYLLMAKARVTPLAGISIPRSEANGLLYSYKLANVCLRAVKVKPATVHFLVDSSCLMAAMKSTRGRLSPYLANRRAQIEEFITDWAEKYPSTKVNLPKHIPGHRNVADIGTRGLAVAKDVDMGSEWQDGPNFLSLSCESWPVTK